MKPPRPVLQSPLAPFLPPPAEPLRVNEIHLHASDGTPIHLRFDGPSNIGNRTLMQFTDLQPGPSEGATFHVYAAECEGAGIIAGLSTMRKRFENKFQ